MEYFLTTYSKDFTWPVQFSAPKDEIRQNNKNLALNKKVEAGDACCLADIKHIEVPEITPAQTGAPPAGPESKYGQPNAYLKKLYMKYPYLYNILSITPPEQLAKAVYDDKFQSTYTSDYSLKEFTPLRDWLIPENMEEMDKEMQQAAEMDDERRKRNALENKGISSGDQEKKPCSCPATRVVCTCGEGGTSTPGAAVQPLKIAAFKPMSITKIPRPQNLRETKPPEYKGTKAPPRPSKMRSEYKDTISKMGGIIIDKKLLLRWPKEEPWERKK